MSDWAKDMLEHVFSVVFIAHYICHFKRKILVVTKVFRTMESEPQPQPSHDSVKSSSLVCNNRLTDSMAPFHGDILCNESALQLLYLSCPLQEDTASLSATQQLLVTAVIVVGQASQSHQYSGIQNSSVP